MAKIICLFNHKGGVSKTTTVFNLGWMLGLKGQRVLLADFDPQCNLTGMVMGFKGIDDLEAVYNSAPPNNVKDALAPAFESQPKAITAAQCVEVGGNANLMLLPGHIGLAEYVTTLGIAQQLGGSLLALRNMPGAIRFMLDETAAACNADYVIVDMSPSLGPMNQNLISTSDYFVVPLHPDYFSAMALSSLAATLPKWRAWAETARNIDMLANADYPFPQPHVTFLGAIIQKYRPRNGRASQAFQHWIDQLILGLRDTLVPRLVAERMVDIADYRSKVAADPWQPLLEVPDFNSLIAYSQEHQVPVYSLTPEQLGQDGAVWTRTKMNMEQFEAAFSSCADKILQLTN
jgi:cellulose biosynthesis protein BcsQ